MVTWWLCSTSTNVLEKLCDGFPTLNAACWSSSVLTHPLLLLLLLLLLLFTV